jgi:hypothetical protein
VLAGASGDLLPDLCGMPVCVVSSVNHGPVCGMWLVTKHLVLARREVLSARRVLTSAAAGDPRVLGLGVGVGRPDAAREGVAFVELRR